MKNFSKGVKKTPFCVILSKVIKMKLHEINFREIDQQIVRIQGNEVLKQLHSMNLDAQGLTAGMFYCYIDHEKGLTFELLALELENGNFLIAPKEYSYKLRCRPLLDEEIMILKDVNTEVFKEKIEAINETYKVSEDIFKTRYIKEIDDSRHSEYPDDVRVFLLKKDKDPEACWVRITGTNGRKLTGKILTKTMQDFDLELEEIIEFGTMTMEDNSISCVCIL